MSLTPVAASIPFSEATPRSADAAGSDRRALVVIALLTIGVTALLQIWRPYFHLTDDNLSGYLPGVTEFNRKLWSGQWPFISDGVFGGQYNLLSDPGVFGLFSPWMFLFSWLSLTPFYYLLVDVVSLCNSLAIALAFGWSALWLRRRYALDAPDWLLIALSISYTFTPYNLLIGSSWIGFLNGQAAMPLMLVGMLMTSHTRAVWLQCLALLYALFGGHAHTFVMTCLFSGVLAIGVGVATRSLVPVARTLFAGVLAAVFMLPVLLQSFEGFRGSPRAAGVPLADARARRLEPPMLLGTMVAGPLATLVARAVRAYSDGMATTFSTSYSPANLLFLLALIRSARHRAAVPRVAWALLACFAAAALMVTRPEWLAVIVAQLPLLRSLQWPFREIWVLLFALHLFLLFGVSAISRRSQRLLFAAGALITCVILGSPPPTWYEFALDRRLIVSGVAEGYWRDLRASAGTTPRVVVGIDPELLEKHRDEIPFTLLGTYNFGSLYGFTSRSGYTFTVDLRADSTGADERPYYFAGAYTPKQARSIAAREPGLWWIELASVRPAEWIIHTGSDDSRYRYDSDANMVVKLMPHAPPAGR